MQINSTTVLDTRFIKYFLLIIFKGLSFIKPVAFYAGAQAL